MNAWHHYWLRQTLIEQSKRHRMGYEWAMSELHRGSDPKWYLLGGAHDKYGSDPYFDRGAADAIFDFGRMNADAMWNQRKEQLA